MFFHPTTHHPVAINIKLLQQTLKLLDEIDIKDLQNNLNTIYAHQKMIDQDYHAINTRIKHAHSLLLKVSDLLEDAAKWGLTEILAFRLDEENMFNRYLQKYKKLAGRWPSLVHTPARLTIQECGFSDTLNQSHSKYLFNLHQKIITLLQNKLLTEIEHTQQSVMRQKWF